MDHCSCLDRFLYNPGYHDDKYRVFIIMITRVIKKPGLPAARQWKIPWLFPDQVIFLKSKYTFKIMASIISPSAIQNPRSHPEQYYHLNETQWNKFWWFSFPKFHCPKNTNKIFKDIVNWFCFTVTQMKINLWKKYYVSCLNLHKSINCVQHIHFVPRKLL